MITQGANPGGATDRPRSRSLNLDHPARPFHAADPSNANRATFDGFQRSINSLTLCPENRGRYSDHLSHASSVSMAASQRCSNPERHVAN